MVKTITGMLVSLALILGISTYEVQRVKKIFFVFGETLQGLYRKAEDQTANYEDGRAVKLYWEDKKKELHVWISHISIENVDYQLNEALGYLYEKKYDDALPKIEVLIGLSEKIPAAYSFSLENIF